MLCWLAFGEHETLKRYMTGVGILIPASWKNRLVGIWACETFYLRFHYVFVYVFANMKNSLAWIGPGATPGAAGGEAGGALEF